MMVELKLLLSINLINSFHLDKIKFKAIGAVIDQGKIFQVVIQKCSLTLQLSHILVID